MLLVVLLIVIGGIAYFAVKKNNNTTPTTVATHPRPSPAAADAALAASINLHPTDLPAGWSRSPRIGAGADAPASGPAAAQVPAVRGLSSCLGQPFALVAGLFGNATVPGSSAVGHLPDVPERDRSGHPDGSPRPR